MEKAGAWFSYDGNRIGQGRENAKQYFANTPEAAKKLETAIRAAAGQVEETMLAGPGEEKDAAA